MRTPAQYQMMLWTLLAVLIGGAGVFASVVQPPAEIRQLRAASLSRELSQTKIEVASVRKSTGSTDRGPASTEPQFSALSIDDKGTQAVEFNLPCDGQGHFSQNVAQVRLTGKLCGHRGGQIETSEIRNVTNGFSATVFYPGAAANTFTTDYMTLASGENHIRIEHILKSGVRVESDFVIERK